MRRWGAGVEPSLAMSKPVWVAAALFAGALLLGAPGVTRAQAPAAAGAVSYSKDIVPILKENCAKCHGQKNFQGGISLATHSATVKGGKGGKSFAAKAEDSRFYKYLTGELKPKMPIGGSLKPAEMQKIKAWIDAGAKADVGPDQVVISDTAIPVIKVPKIALRVPMLPEATALAWSKDNKILAIGTYKTVRLVDPASGQTLKELTGPADKIHALRFSPDGTKLASAGGPPAQGGEIHIWEVPAGNLLKTITGHNDFIYSISWSPDGKNIASASYDKLAKIWDVATGNEVKTLKDHADAVYAVAYNPAGTLIATGSADRSVKVWDVATGKRVYTLGGHTDIVFSLAWNAGGNQLTSVGADKLMRTWNVNAAAGQAARNVGAHEKTIQQVVYSPDGGKMATASDDKTVKIWNAANSGALQTLKDFPDSMLSVAFNADGSQLAVGGYDGTVKIYNTADGKLISTVIDLPKAPAKPEVKPAPKPEVKPEVKPVTKPAAAEVKAPAAKK